MLDVRVKKPLLLAAVAAAALVAASPASSALVLCSTQNCAPVDENVLFNGDGVVTGTTLNAHTNQSNAPVVFTADHTVQASGGQASLTDLGDAPLTGMVEFHLTGFSFTSFELNFPGIPGNPPPAEATSITFTVLGAGGVPYVIALPTFSLDGAGENFMSGYTNGGDVITSVSFTLNPQGGGVDALKQLRLGGVSAIQRAVPEPATWAMMLIGFGGIGYSMRRRPARHMVQAV